MDDLLKTRVQNALSEIENQLSKKEDIDPMVAKLLLGLCSSRIQMLLTHVGYLENNLQESKAEVQRLSQIANYS
jgi:hypothetical protein